MICRMNEQNMIQWVLASRIVAVNNIETSFPTFQYYDAINK